ncbi:ComF family protein [Ornithinimicrobium sp. LYQ121]|uniref:ComF family protein n=1 Tax=Ornithinimicrobium sp. LYQ121 TaxID=3378801 RepID=UPI0038549E29
MPWRPWEDVLALVELAAPSACAGCALAGQRWCERCATVLGATAPRPWGPTPSPPGMPPTWVGPAYADEVRAAVVVWKDGGRADLTARLAPVLRDVLAAALDGSPPHRAALRAGRSVAVVPAPSSPASIRARGEHRVASLAGAALGRRARPLRVVDALRLSRHVADQAGLGSAQRWRNLAGAVRVRSDVVPGLRGVPCVVVDDVVTTGATLVECARALREAGSGPVVAVTVAATQRSGRRPGTRGAPSTPALPEAEGSD